ncbi:MAG: hypothetical protein LBF78_01170 [Treponema sp.]|jgi:hypothetical protein|nr:hypothetical protein [Treponema sp.]
MTSKERVLAAINRKIEAPSENHNVQADIPVENIITMYKTAKKIPLA